MEDRAQYQDNSSTSFALKAVRLDEVNRLIESIGRAFVEIDACSEESGVLLGILRDRQAELQKDLGLDR